MFRVIGTVGGKCVDEATHDVVAQNAMDAGRSACFGLSLEALPLPALVSSADGRVVAVNEAFATLADHSQTRLHGRQLEQVMLIRRADAESPPATEERTAPAPGLMWADVVRTGRESLPVVCRVWPATGAESEDLTLIVVLKVSDEEKRRGLPPTKDSRFYSRFLALIDTIFDAYYDWHIPTDLVEFSAQLDSLLDIGADTRPRTFTDWIGRLHPDDRQAAVARCREAARRGGVYRDEYRLQRDDGSYAVVADRGLTLEDEFGSPSHMVGVMRDVTRERETERALREAAELYGTLFERAANPAFRIGQSGRYLDANEAGLAFLETTKKELLESRFVQHWGEEVLQSLRQVFASGESSRLDVEAEVNGSAKAVILTMTPCHIAGELTCFALATDIADRRALQRSLEESNIALRVILDQRTQDRADLERRIRTNVADMVLPLLGRLRQPLAQRPEATYLDTAMQNLQEIVSPIADSLNPQDGPPLTIREREIANLIRAGKTTAEIATALYISPGTVAFHRKNLRGKFGLDAHGPHLASYLASLPDR